MADSTRVIAYAADAAILHPQCAIDRYVNTYGKYAGILTVLDSQGHIQGYGREGNEIWPIFAYESHTVQDNVCDACLEPIVDN